MVQGTKRRVAVLGVAALIFLPWPTLAAAWLILDPGLTEWTMMVAAAAVTTEAGLYLGAVVLGVSSFRRIRNRLRFRRAKDEDNDAASARSDER
jgi:hypothetical protein